MVRFKTIQNVQERPVRGTASHFEVPRGAWEALSVKRGELIMLLSGVAAAWPFTPRAQELRQPAINIGVLTDMSDTNSH
jgi:hypothetical protein